MILIVLFNLKDANSMAAYEKWASSTDIPTVKRLSSVDDFRLFKTSGVLGTESPAPYQYVEIIEVNSMEQLGADISSDTMQKVAAQFQTFADNPIFMMSHQIA
jgi:hypothetical protein